MTSFQSAGEICHSCADRWAKKGTKPKILVLLPNTTAKKELEVVACPFCDGEPIIKNAPGKTRGS